MAKTSIFSVRLKDPDSSGMEEYILHNVTYDLDTFSQQTIRLTPKNFQLNCDGQLLLLKSWLKDRFVCKYTKNNNSPIYIYLCVLVDDSTLLSYRMKVSGYEYDSIGEYLCVNLIRVDVNPSRLYVADSYKIESDVLNALSLGSIVMPNIMPNIAKIIFNNPATIVFWTDGTKTIVKAHDEEFSEEHGLSMAIAKKFLDISGEKYPRAAFKRLIREASHY